MCHRFHLLRSLSLRYSLVSFVSKKFKRGNFGKSRTDCQDFYSNLLENFELKIERKFWKDFNYSKLVFHTVRVFDKKYSYQNISNRRLIIIMRCLDMFGQVYVFERKILLFRCEPSILISFANWKTNRLFEEFILSISSFLYNVFLARFNFPIWN